MTRKTTNQPINVREEIFQMRRRFKLRDSLFLASALLSTAILLVVAWVIDNQVVGQARHQVQAEIEDLLPVYQAVWDEHARGLATLGRTMANSPNVKIILGDPRASKDRETLREMLADFGDDPASRVDLALITDGAGRISFAGMRDNLAPPVVELAAAREVAESQEQRQGFAIIGHQLFQLSLTPVLLQSGSDEYQNTLAVLGIGLELSRSVAQEIKLRTHSDIIFLAAGRIYASSLEPNAEAGMGETMISGEIDRAEARPLEVRVGSQLHLAFTRQLPGFDGQRIGQVMMLRSLAEAGRFFRSISNLLILLWTLSIAAAFVLSFLVARRITQPMEVLMIGTREFGRGNYDYEISAEAHGELGELAGAFEQMRRSLKQTQAELLRRERLATIGQTAGSIVHDLRNPLATISTAAEILSRDGLAPERCRTLLDSQLRATQRMQAMLRELLDFARGSYDLKLEHHSLVTLVDRAIQGVSRSAVQAGVIIEAEIAADLSITADAERMRRVFENLLTNSIQAMPEGGRVLIKAASLSDHLRIDVIDNGPGVPLEIQDRLFEPFVSDGKSGGTGLGLAIAQSIIEAHKGTINLEADVMEGVDISIKLPLNESS
jgi:signal transduction histidine kinase